jgi:two-component system response regulator
MNKSLVEILLIEDDKNDAELTIRALRKNKLANNLIHLKDGTEALNFLFGLGDYESRNTNNKPKVILLDVKMPKINGLEVLKRIKADELTKKIPVVMLSSSKENQDIEHSYLLGANGYVVKPVEFDAFIKVVSALGLYWLIFNQPPD